MARGLGGRSQAMGHLFEPPPQLLAELGKLLKFVDCLLIEVKIGGILCENQQIIDSAVHVRISRRLV